MTKQNLGWPVDPPFYVPEEVLHFFRQAVDRGKAAECEWNATFARYAEEFPDLAREFQQVMRGELPEDWDAALPVFAADEKGMATRVALGKAMNAAAEALPAMVGGSADVNPSTHTVIENGGDFQNPDYRPQDRQGAVGGSWGYQGRNIHFGVREHAMGAIANGMAAHGGIIPYASTFFVFSDYMRPPIRMAAMMGLGVIFIFTHDSIGVGEDGPTHQPVEHLAALRVIPGLTVIRPCDANEAVVAWRVAVQTRNRPVAIVLTRQEVPILDRTRYGSAEGLWRGAYVLEDAPDGKPDLILMATGSEVSLIVEAQKKLSETGLAVRTVSMPSWELFDAQPQEYRDEILPPSVRARLAVEAGVSHGWRKYIGDGGDMIGLDRFGSSAPSRVVFEKLGFTVDNVVARALKLIQK